MVVFRVMSEAATQQNVASDRVKLTELALVFLKLGTTAFGGPAPHIAMMEEEFVRRRRWVSHAEFLDRLGAANLIPGPSSTEVAIFIGQSKRGWPGLIVTGTCFIIPAAILVTLIAAVYVRYGSLPQVAGILYGIKPAVIAIILQALWSLGRSATKSVFLAITGVVSVISNAFGLAPLAVLAVAGLVCGASAVMKRSRQSAFVGSLSLKRLLSFAALGTATVAATPVNLVRLFVSFLKIGSIVFGSGYVLLAFLRSEFVDRLHWLTEKQLIDAVAVGQFTPGPVFTAATFIGYVVAGVAGATVATIGIFLPGFLLVAASGPLIPRLRRSPVAAAVLDGVIVGSLAILGVVAWQLGRTAIVDWFTALILVASLVALLRFRLNSAWIVAGAAILGCAKLLG